MNTYAVILTLSSHFESQFYDLNIYILLEECQRWQTDKRDHKELLQSNDSQKIFTVIPNQRYLIYVLATTCYRYKQYNHSYQLCSWRQCIFITNRQQLTELSLSHVTTAFHICAEEHAEMRGRNRTYGWTHMLSWTNSIICLPDAKNDRKCVQKPTLSQSLCQKMTFQHGSNDEGRFHSNTDKMDKDGKLTFSTAPLNPYTFSG